MLFLINCGNTICEEALLKSAMKIKEEYIFLYHYKNNLKYELF